MVIKINVTAPRKDENKFSAVVTVGTTKVNIVYGKTLKSLLANASAEALKYAN